MSLKEIISKKLIFRFDEWPSLKAIKNLVMQAYLFDLSVSGILKQFRPRENQPRHQPRNACGMDYLEMCIYKYTISYDEMSFGKGTKILTLKWRNLFLNSSIIEINNLR